MKVNGIKLREAIKLWAVRLDVASKQFGDSLWQFPNDNRGLPTPQELSTQFREADLAIAQLQTAQQTYNLQNMTDFQGVQMPLALLIKLVGNAGRFSKMWSSAAQNTGRDRYSSANVSRSKEDEYAERKVSVKDSLSEAGKAAIYASGLRNAIAVANTKELDIVIDPKYFG